MQWWELVSAPFTVKVACKAYVQIVLLLVLEFCFLELFLWTFGSDAAALIVSAGKWFIPRRALICFARSVPRGRPLNTVAFASN